MARVEKDYEELLALFNKHKVHYLIVEAYAVAYYAVRRYTKDLEVFVEASQPNSRRIIRLRRRPRPLAEKLSRQGLSEGGFPFASADSAEGFKVPRAMPAGLHFARRS